MSDWPSEEAYLEDVAASSEKVDDLLSTFAQAAQGVTNGELSYPEYGLVVDTGRDALKSHRDHFWGTTPPIGYEEPHQLFLDGLRQLDLAYREASDGVREPDADAIDRSADLLRQAQQTFDDAAAAMP